VPIRAEQQVTQLMRHDVPKHGCEVETPGAGYVFGLLKEHTGDHAESSIRGECISKLPRTKMQLLGLSAVVYPELQNPRARPLGA
jgi:hypothetical protein